MTIENPGAEPINRLSDREEFETNFFDFLLQKAAQSGFSEAKQQAWAGYMYDPARGEETLNTFVSGCKLTFKSGVFPKEGKSQRALDIGCGFGSLMMALEKRFDYAAGIEIQQERVDWAKKRAPKSEIICGSAAQLPWQDNFFDVVISTDVFEHIPADVQQLAAAEISRVLKPGGHAFISVPNRFQIKDEHNHVLFGTWLPNRLREKYVMLASKNKRYERCWERSRLGWTRLFANQGLQVSLEALKPRILSSLLPATRYNLYLTK
jgi:2-polyprenyl-3-methyl-5-hydroxy-6-metoxy-1,4-benzoquinol methylase